MQMDLPDGHQRPRLFYAPNDPVGSLGDEAIDLAAMAGLELDDWQQFLMRHLCSVSGDPSRTFWNPFTRRRESKWSALEACIIVSRQSGKGPESLDSEILTTDGWTTFRNIREGQYVYGSAGRPVRVMATSPVCMDEDCYRVGFTDGTSRVVGAGHLWSVSYRSQLPATVRTTAYLASRVGGERPDNGRMEYNWRVRCDTVVETPHVDLPVDPYLLGYWLGGGTSRKSQITVGHTDREWVMGRIAATGARIGKLTLHDHGNAWDFYFSLDARVRDGFESRCRRLGIWGAKRIPEMYLTASVEQRKQLLAGLVDSDGSIATTARSPQVEFSTSIPELAEGVHRLLRSLGIRATPRVCKSTLYGERKRDRTRFNWTPTFNPFEMPRKAEKFTPPASRRHEWMSITNIERVPTVPVRCIQVDAKDGIYLTGRHFTPTHNSLLEARELAGLYVFGERTIVHTAHEAPTANEHFKRVVALIEGCPTLSRELAVNGIKRGNSERSINLKSGQRLLFRTRTKGGGRGFSGDLVVMDEAMFLGSEPIAALLPTMSARPNGQIIYTGSAGDQELGDCSQLGALRRRGMKGGDPALVFAEWSADVCTEFCPKDCDEHDRIDDPESYAKANPAFGIRISYDFIEAERRSMSKRDFLRERLGVGDYPADEGAWRVIPQDAWNARTDHRSQVAGAFALGVDITPDRSSACLVACGAQQADSTLEHVEITSMRAEDGVGVIPDHRPMGVWLTQRIIEIWRKSKPAFVVIDKATHAGGLVSELEAAGVRVVCPSSREYAQACGEFRSAVVTRDGEPATLVHPGQPQLAAALAEADKRRLMDMWAWDKRSSAADISPLVAATLARWGFREHLFKAPASPWVAVFDAFDLGDLGDDIDGLDDFDI